MNSLGWARVALWATVSFAIVASGVGLAAPVAGAPPPAVHAAVTVSEASPARVTHEKSLLVFDETGLATGHRWTVKVVGPFDGRLGAKVHSSRTSTISFPLPSGAFNFTVKPVKGYSEISTGAVLVAGASASVSVSFSYFHPVRAVPPVGGDFGAPLGARGD